MAAAQTQPSTVKPTFKSILTLPFRLCNPPPAIGKVRSFGVTPLFDVRLDDVLSRKHLPPLGLKDFEEWLLYVEMCPENLYFILWLQEYRARYAEWQRQRNSPKDAVFASTAASRLATFYSRARQTFFTPNANYELNLPSSLLAPFQGSDRDAHPDPSLFQQAEEETRRMLEQSLRRFIQGQMSNVGNSRVLCGIIAGIIITLIGFLPPTIANFVTNERRWLRLTALPGMWLGLSVFFAALHGVCLGVYIFGDLRQLRKFELARPAPPSRKSDSRPRFPQPISLPPTPTAVYGRSHRHRQKRPGSPVSVSEFSDTTLSLYPRDVQSFPLAPAYFESNPIEGPSTCPILLEYFNPENDAEWLRQQELQREQERKMESEPSSPDSFTSTATFIAPFCSPSTTDISGYWDSEEILSMNARWYRLRAMEDLEKLSHEAARRQPLAEFDFDGLPPPIKQKKPESEGGEVTEPEAPWNHNPPNRGPEQDVERASLDWDTERPRRWQWFLDFVDRVQTRCSLKKWGPNPGTTDGPGPVFLGGAPPYLPSTKSSTQRSRSRPISTSKSTLSITTYATVDSEITEGRVKKRKRLINAVPAFAVPLTKVLSPVIVRGQWEIVVRSSALAFVVSWIVCAALLAAPLR